MTEIRAWNTVDIVKGEFAGREALVTRVWTKGPCDKQTWITVRSPKDSTKVVILKADMVRP